MLRPVDLFTTATSGIMASSRLIQTTGNNIANINTEGFVRERTSFEGGLFGSTGRGNTERLLNVFAQNQLRRDTSTAAELDAFVERATQVDQFLSQDSVSIAGGLSRFFAALQTATDDPTNLASRQQTLMQADSLRRQFGVVSDYLLEAETLTNQQLASEVTRANDIIASIGELNRAILATAPSMAGDIPSNLLNQRDNAVLALSELVGINVRENATGALLINLNSGESLVLEDGSFNLITIGNSVDSSNPQLQLRAQPSPNVNATVLNLRDNDLGGRIGGLLAFRDDLVAPAQRDLGQLALAFADAFNQQNRLGMNFDQAIGGDIFRLPASPGLPFPGTAAALNTSVSVLPGSGNNLTDADFRVTVTATTAGNMPAALSIELLNADGSVRRDAAGNPISLAGSVTPVGADIRVEVPAFGVAFDFAAGNFSEGDSFLFQPTKRAGSALAMNTMRSEDLAFAQPLRATPDADNFGNASIAGVTINNTSAFTANGQLLAPGAAPGGVFGAPTRINFTASDAFEVRDAAGNLLTTVTGITSFENLLAQAQNNGTAPPWPAAFSAAGFPGFDVSLRGRPEAGDGISLAFNTNGTRDNGNALLLSGLQQQGNVQLGNGSSVPRTFHDAFATLVSFVGQSTASAEISQQAAVAMRDQSQAWFESQSGVNLDEEAANLIRFQQSYSAAARILSTAQELFNTLLAAVR